MQLKSEGGAGRGQLYPKPSLVVLKSSRLQDHTGEPAYMVCLSLLAMAPWKEAADTFLVAIWFKCLANSGREVPDILGTQVFLSHQQTLQPLFSSKNREIKAQQC